MDVINEIRLKNGFDPEMLKRVAMDPDIASSMNATLENLEQALKNLSEELYSKSTHFVFEFIQNADDNTYATGVIPTLRMRIEDSQASFHCNELGFTRENVDAICRVGASTKKTIHGYIGEKGIGFKSVFKVADMVFISSGPYTFKLDKREKLGMITPIWTHEYPVSPGWTSFYLHLSRNGKDLASHTNDIKSSILLFLRKLRSLTIEVALSTGRANRTIQLLRHETDDKDIIKLERTVDGAHVSLDTYFMIKHVIRTYTQEPKRRNIKKTEIVLAFPITAKEMPIVRGQDVHAFLPLRSYGFNFIIQADFLTSTSREAILSDLPWNLTLREGVVDTFVEAVEHLKQRPTLEYIWFRFLPSNITDAFFHPLENNMKRRLRRIPIFRSTDGTYRLPSEVIIVPDKFRDDKGLPLIPESFLSGVYYLSTSYDIATDGTHFRTLGVCDMSDEQFIHGLQRMEGQLSHQPDTWHEAVCNGLTNIPRSQYGHMLHLRDDIRRLNILPLSDGTWTSSYDAREVFFDLKFADIPDDLGLCSLKPGIKTYSARYQLFEELGVKPADAVLVAGRILMLHGNPSYSAPNVASLISHSQFMFAHRDLRGFPLPGNLRVMDEQGDTAKGSELYMDLPWSRRRMRDVLPQPPARFINPGYLKVYDDESMKDWWQWRQWLQDYLHINISPRLISGDLSPEFVEMTRTLESCELLIVLKDSWSQLQGKMSQTATSQIAQTTVICEDGTSQAISATYVGRKPLKGFELPFLPIDDPDDQQWDFLKYFGVSAEVNGSFFIKRLIQLQQHGCKDEDIIKDTYKQLEARFNDDPIGIRSAFEREPLIFVSRSPQVEKSWIGFSDAVWSGPPSMRFKVALKATYPSLEDLFLSKLGLSNPPVQDILVDEIKIIAEEWKLKNISTAVKDQVLNILFDITGLLRIDTQSTSPEWLETLHDEAIFPVDVPSKLITLCTADNHFYIPDNLKYEKMCRGHLQILSLESTRLPWIQPLLDSRVFKSRILYLGSAVKYNSIASGTRILEIETTEKYAGRLQYMERVVCHAQPSSPIQDTQMHLSSLRNLSIFSVDSIESTFSLDDFNCTDADYLAIDEQPNMFSILISKACPRYKWDLFICAKLGALLGISKDKLQSIVLQPIEAMEDWLELEGVPETAANTFLDQSWLQDANTVSSPNEVGISSTSAGQEQWWQHEIPATYTTTPPFPENSWFPGPNGPLYPLNPATFRGIHQIAPGGFFGYPWQQGPISPSGPPLGQAPVLAKPSRSLQGQIRRSIDGMSPSHHNESSKNGTVIALSRQTTIADPAQAGNYVQRYIDQISQSPSQGKTGYGLSHRSVQPWHSNVQPTALSKATFIFPGVVTKYFTNAFEKENGILGESLVYDIFSRDLPDFGQDNWTSELRAFVPGFTPFEGSAVADFRYHDHQGILTGLWYGEQRKAAWSGQWPTYHVEVKSTSNTVREAFHMSARQLEIALDLTIRDPNHIPLEVYVILRVSGVRTLNPSFAVYIDPHCHLYDGELQVTNEVYIVGK